MSHWLTTSGAPRFLEWGQASSPEELERETQSFGKRARVAFPWMPAFLLALMLPTEFSIFLGGLRLSPYRILILLAFVPCLDKMLKGVAGKWILPDFLMIAHVCWAVLAYLYRDGPAGAIESGGIYAAEAFGAYMIARTCIRTREDFIKMGRILFGMVVLFAIITVPESITHVHFVHDIFGSILGNRPGTDVEGRFGLARAYGPYDHPILYGTMAAITFSIAWNLRPPNRDGFGRRLGRGLLVGVATFTSLSAGCFMALLMQAGMTGYRWVTAQFKSRWAFLASAFVMFYMVISLISDRSGLKALLWYLTFDRHTASYRIAIWEYAGDNIDAKPMFGVGMEHWVRPDWMAESVDSFWLVTALSFGLPATYFLAIAVLNMAWRVGRTSQTDEHSDRLRLAWVFTMMGMCLVAFTVHFWNNLFVTFFFVLGAGSWLLQEKGIASEEGAGEKR